MSVTSATGNVVSALRPSYFGRQRLITIFMNRPMPGRLLPVTSDGQISNEILNHMHFYLNLKFQKL